MGRLRHLSALAAAGVGAALLAACGASGTGAGQTGTGAAASGGPGLQLANCMRSHGVTNFPDPSPNGSIRLVPGTGINPQSPAFMSAQKACARYGPKGGGPIRMSASQRRQAVAFAECVRAHGMPNFPDPSLGRPAGAGTVIALHGMVFVFTSGFDPRSPAFRRAATACGVKLPPG